MMYIPSCRSCEAGLQAGAAKFQTLTLFSSRRAVENFIKKHVSRQLDSNKNANTSAASDKPPGRLLQQATFQPGSVCNRRQLKCAHVKDVLFLCRWTSRCQWAAWRAAEGLRHSQQHSCFTSPNTSSVHADLVVSAGSVAVQKALGGGAKGLVANTSKGPKHQSLCAETTL